MGKIRCRRITAIVVNTIIVLVFVVTTLMFVRTYIYDLYVVPSESMLPTLIPNDYILVNKITPLKKIVRNDVTVFKFPRNPKITFVKRCCGMPGDTVEIKNNILKVNGEEEDNINKVLFSCTVKKDIEPELPEENKVQGYFKTKIDNNNQDLTIIVTSIENLKHIGLSVENTDTFNNSNNLYPRKSSIKSTRDNWGPIVIPHKGMKINADSTLVMWYAHIIKKYENHTISLKNNVLYIDGKQSDFYTIKNNYYFMLGDNRHFSRDSRYWGFVPDNHLIGVVKYTMFNTGKFNVNTHYIWE